jgi:hypothetical protein
LLLKSSSKGFHFVTKIFMLIYFMFALILILLSVLFDFKVDNFVNHYFYWLTGLITTWCLNQNFQVEYGCLFSSYFPITHTEEDNGK